MKSAPRGRSTSVVEVANVSPHGFWLLIGDRDRFVPFAQFPWFLTKVLVPLYSGWMLQRYCPADGARDTETMWLIFGFIARNLYTLLPGENSFSDPEFNNSNSNTIGVGGYFQMPPTRSFGVNLNIEF